MNPPLTGGKSPILAFPIRTALLLLALVAGCREAAPSSRIVIGHVAPVDSTSERLAVGEELRRLDADSPVVGLRWGAVHALGGRTPEQVLGQANRLAAIDRVHVLVGGLSAIHADRLGQVASSEPILALTLAEHPLTPTQNWQWCFGVSPSDRGRWLARIARDDLHLQRIAVLRCADEPPCRSLEAFLAEYKLGKGSVEEIVASKDTAADALEGRLEKSRSDGVFVAVAAPTNLPRTLKIPAFYGGDEAERTAWRPGDSPAYAISAWSDDPERLPEAARLWRERWLSAHGRPPDAAAALMADAIRVLAEAVVRSGGFSPQRVRDELRRDGAVWSGLAGPLRIDSSQSCHRTCFALRWNGSAWKTQARLEVEGD